MIPIVETDMIRIFREKYPDDSWQQMVSAGRLQKARALFEQRQRRKERVELLDCLQFGEKGGFSSTTTVFEGRRVCLCPRRQKTP